MENLLDQMPQQLANGLTLGAVYALIALGYSLVYGVLRLLNFAHGEVYMVGAYVGYGVLRLLTASGELRLPGWLTIALMLLAAMLVAGLVGLLIERVAYRPLRRAHKLAPLLSAIGVSFIIQQMVVLLASANHRAINVDLLLPAGAALEIAGARFSAARLLLLLTAVALLLGLYLLVRHSGFGRAMRAVAADREAAAMLGIKVDRVVGWSFFLGSALAGAAGVLVALVFTRIWHLMGVMAGLKGFTAAVLGGIGSLPGAMLGGLLLGLAESLGSGFISAAYADLIVFVTLIATLLLRPRGILGRPGGEKV